jgi:hypothetical protein
MTISQFHPFAWPVVVLIIAIVALFAYRPPVSRFLDRLKGVGLKSPRWNLQASAAPQATNSTGLPRVSDEAKAIFDPILLQEQKDIVKKEVIDKHYLEGEAREEELITALATTVLFYGFDSTYFIIFGSQLGALQQLNSEPMLAVEALRPWYELGAIGSPTTYENYSFEQWLNFLQLSGLIRRDNGPTVQITIRGRSFLKYLVHRGYPLTKPA